MNYCSLKDAFKVPNFSKKEEELNYPVHEVIEEFKEPELPECYYIQEHIKNCRSCSVLAGTPSDMDFNYILNIILIILMLWIIIYKPSM